MWARWGVQRTVGQNGLLCPDAKCLRCISVSVHRHNNCLSTYWNILDWSSSYLERVHFYPFRGAKTLPCFTHSLDDWVLLFCSSICFAFLFSVIWIYNIFVFLDAFACVSNTQYSHIPNEFALRNKTDSSRCFECIEEKKIDSNLIFQHQLQ